MKNKAMPEIVGKIWLMIKKNKFVMAVLLVGLVLILLPTGVPATPDDAVTSTAEQVMFSLAEQERRISEALSTIDGAGKVTVVLTLKCTVEQVLAQDETVNDMTSEKADSSENNLEKTTTTVIISSGSSTDAPVTLKYIYPEYLGALIVCQGADDVTVKYQLVQAVAGLTGLGTDKIVITKMNKLEEAS